MSVALSSGFNQGSAPPFLTQRKTEKGRRTQRKQFCWNEANFWVSSFFVWGYGLSFEVVLLGEAVEGGAEAGDGAGEVQPIFAVAFATGQVVEIED